MTAISPKTRQSVYDREAGCCARCGVHCLTGPHSVHHRRPKGMGGSSSTATASLANLILLCGTGVTGCHGWVESNRTLATRAGWLCPSWADPADWPVERRPGVWSQPGEGWAAVAGPVLLVPVVGES